MGEVSLQNLTKTHPITAYGLGGRSVVRVDLRVDSLVLRCALEQYSAVSTEIATAEYCFFYEVNGY
jgi:hypothetical protein